MVGCSHWLVSQFTAYELYYICNKLAVSLALASNKCEDSEFPQHFSETPYIIKTLLWVQSSYVILWVFSDGKGNLNAKFRNEHALYKICNIEHFISNIDRYNKS